jgi:phytol kinase
MTNTLGFLIVCVYIAVIIGTAELLRRQRGYSPDFTRKVVHIGVGMLSWALPFLFDAVWPFLVGCALFVIITWLDWRYGFLMALASKDRQNLGTVYFPIAAGVVAWLFWETPPLMVAALMPLTWGDGLAPVVSRAYGRHPYTVFGHTRTLQGSAGFFVGGLLFTWLALWAMPGLPPITPLAALPAALVISLATSLTEAVSVRGLDNLTITAVAIAILTYWPF